MEKREFKRKLKEKTLCDIQHNGWTCGTCFFAISEELNNEHWKAVLFYRGDYTLEEMEMDKSWDYKSLLEEVWELIK